MALNNDDQANVRKYLLGHLGDEEQQTIEERLMLEDDLFEELEISKGELIEEYSAGELSSKERDWFESHFLASAEGKQRHTFASAMDRIASKKPAKESSSWFQRLKTFLSASPWVISTATAGAVLLTVGIIVWTRSTQPQGSLAVTLANSALTRSTNGAKYTRVALKPDVGEVRLTLPLPAGVAPGVDYRVELDNRSSERKTLKPAAHDPNSVSVVIPAEQLPPGFYALILFAIQADGSERAIPGNYFFTVERED